MTVNLTYSTFEGIYEIPEAARYLKGSLELTMPYTVTSSKVIRWIRQGLASPELVETPGRQMLITFEDLVSMRIIAALRVAGVSFSKIYKAEKWLRRVTGHKRPFATELLWTEHSDVFTELQSRLIAASRSGQYAMEIIRNYLIPVHGLTFNERKVAQSWEPFADILLQPQIQFGASCIKGTRIPTKTLWAMVKGGDPVELVAQWYKLDEHEIREAIQWEDILAGT